MREDLGQTDQIFAHFDPDPVASASIGQTYFAVLHDGRDVVVKVQRPGIRESVELDLDILARLTDRLDHRATWARSIGLRQLVAGFADATREELDFRIEASNGRAAQLALHAADPITVPDVMDEFTTRRVLVQERVVGRSVGTPGVFDETTPQRRTALADALLSLMVRQMIGGERFHADPHAGNVSLRADGRLALIDFGSVGRLNRFERGGLIDIFRALQSEDPALLRQAALRIGTPSNRVDTEALDRDLARMLAGAVQPGGAIDPAIFGDILTVFRDFNIQLPRSTTVLFRTLLTVLGTLDVIAPGYDVTAALSRLGSELMAPVVAPGDIKDLLQREVLSTAPVLQRLPRDLDDLARSLLRGELRARVSLLSEPEDVREARSLLNRFVLAMIGSALALASSLLLTVQPAGGVSLVVVVGAAGLGFSVLLLLRVIMQVLRDRG